MHLKKAPHCSVVHCCETCQVHGVWVSPFPENVFHKRQGACLCCPHQCCDTGFLSRGEERRGEERRGEKGGREESEVSGSTNRIKAHIKVCCVKDKLSVSTSINQSNFMHLKLPKFLAVISTIKQPGLMHWGLPHHPEGRDTSGCSHELVRTSAGRRETPPLTHCWHLPGTSAPTAGSECGDWWGTYSRTGHLQWELTEKERKRESTLTHQELCYWSYLCLIPVSSLVSCLLQLSTFYLRQNATNKSTFKSLPYDYGYGLFF